MSFGLSQYKADGKGLFGQIPVPYLGSFIHGKLGEPLADALSLAAQQIPGEIEGMDHQAAPWIEALIEMLRQLKSNFPNQFLLNSVVNVLEKFQKEGGQAQLLYPQIVSSPKRVEAAEKTQRLIAERVQPLLAALRDYLNPSLDHHTNQVECLALIDQSIQAFEEIANGQRSLVAKAAHIATQLGLTAVQKLRASITAQRKETFIPNTHPLLQLLALISRYSLAQNYLEFDKVREINLALRKLELQYPIFQGKVPQFNHASLLPDFHAALTQMVQGIISALNPGVKESVSANVILQLKKRLTDYLDQIALGHKREIEAFCAKSSAQLAQCTQGRYEDDPKDALLAEIRLAEGRLRAQHKGQLERETREAQGRLQRIVTGFHEGTDEMMRTLLLPHQQLLPKEIFSPVFLKEVFWKALTYQQQKAAWSRINLGGEMREADILQSLEKAIDYYEQYELIKEGLSEQEELDAQRRFNPYVMAWMSYAKGRVRGAETEPQKIEHIDAAFTFNPRDVTTSLRAVQKCIAESRYWKSRPSSPEAALEALKAVAPPAGPLQHKEKVLESALAAACFEFVAHLLGLQKNKAAIYRRLIAALDALNGPGPDVNVILNAFIAGGNKHAASVEQCTSHKERYIALINILICENSSRFSPAGWAAWASYSSVYDMAERSIRPTSGQIFEEIEEGHFPEQLLKLIRTFGEGKPAPQATVELGCAIVDRIALPDYTQKIGALIGRVKKSASQVRVQHSVFKYPVLVLQYLVSYVLRFALSTVYYAIKSGTYITGAVLKQAAKLYIQKSDIVGRALDKALDSYTNRNVQRAIEKAIESSFEDLDPIQGDEGVLVELKRVAHALLPKLLASVVSEHLKSSLKQDKVDAVLLKASQKLRGERIEAQERAEVTRHIRAALDHFFNELVQTPSQARLEYIRWMQHRVASPGEHNIIQQLKAKFEVIERRADHQETRRDIHRLYEQFMQEMIQFQANDHSSGLAHLVSDLTNLAQLITTFMGDPNSYRACMRALLDFEGQLPAISAKLEREQARTVQVGFQEGMQQKATELFAAITKEMGRKVAKRGIGFVVQELRGIVDDREFVKQTSLRLMSALAKA
jgi:hypothetical protein